MSALDLIKLMQDKELVSERNLAKLREQVEASPKTITAGALAKLLVKKELLTESLARTLLKQLEARRAQPHLSDDLQLLPDDEIQPEAELIEVDEPVPGDHELRPLPEDPIPASDEEPAELVDAEAELAHADGDSLLDDHDSPPIDDLLADGHADDPSTTVVGKRKRGWAAMLHLPGRGQRRKFQANRWDSPLILVGGGALLLLVFVAFGLWFYLSRGTGDDAFTLAYEDYRQQSYGQAISKFEHFVADYPDHPKVSLAKVHIGLAKIWSDVDRERWEEALATSRSELTQIENEDAFAEARPQLASILPDIMDGFANQALKADDVAGAQKYLDLANQAYLDVNNSAYLPTSVRQGQQQRIEQILGKLAAVKHRINQDNELTKTVLDIQAAADQGQIAQAYDLRKTLLKKYPNLEADSRLSEVVLSVTQKERESVAPISAAPQASTDDHTPLSQYQVSLANRHGESAEGVAGRVIFAFAQGAVYGLKAETGNVLWRRYVGLNNPHAPLPLSANADSDVLVVDSVRQELLRLKAETGKLVWRVPCGQPPAAPILHSDRLLLGFGDDETGKLVELDPQSGSVLGGVEFATGLAAGPGVDGDRNIVAQVGSHSSVYLLDGQKWNCLGVHYLGHAEGTVVVPPVIVQQHVIVAENPAPDFSLIHILAPDPENNGVLKPLVDPLRLQGRVVVDMHPFGRRILVATDHGKIYALELDPENAADPVRQIASVTSAVRPGTVGYALLNQGRLWVGDSQLSKYELQTSRGQLVRKWINSKGDVFLAPLQRHADILFAVRKRVNRMGVTVSAIRIDDREGGKRDGETIWETDLGVPPAGEPFVNRAAQEIDVVTGNGTLFAINAAAIRAGIVDQPQSEVIDNQLPMLHQSIPLSQELVAFFGRPATSHLLLFDPANPSQLLRVVPLELQGAEPSALPALFQGGLLVGTHVGPVYLLDAKTGQLIVYPFQPPLKAGTQVDWLPAAVSEDGDYAILGNTSGEIYRLGIKSGDNAQLTATAQAEGDKKLIAQLAVLGNAVFGATRGIGADTVVSFDSAELKPAREWPLQGRIVWGPARIQDGILVASDADELLRIVDEQDPSWQVKLSYGPLAGQPLAIGQDLVLASVSGVIWKLDGQSGAEIAHVDVGEPLATGPVQFAGNRLLVCGGDGTVHVVNLPSNE